MNTSQSQNDLELELRILRLLDQLVVESPSQTITASSVGARLDVSTRRVRPILRDLSVRGLLIPRIVMVCQICRTEKDEDVLDSPSELFCHTCAENEIHEPAVIFEFGDALRSCVRERPPDPKPMRRTQAPRLLRPWTWFGGQRKRRTMA
jgi:hypothetical protein